MLFFLTAFRDFFLTHFSSMMRKNEQNTITGVAFYALGSFMSVVFFPPPIAICCIRKPNTLTKQLLT